MDAIERVADVKERPLQSGDGMQEVEQTRPVDARVLERSLLDFIPVSWEVLAWAALLIVAAVARFYLLGVRAMSHDESLHALYSYYLYDAGNYEHNPMMHGPLLFHVNALVYFLFGDTDTTARIAPALAGLGVVAMVIPFRRYIGRLGALAAGILVAFSPSLLFHSRYIRNDIYIALFALVWIFAAFRYLEAPNERRMRWLTVMSIAMALGFITKENNFILGALVGAFFVMLALWQVIGSSAFLVAAPVLFAASAAFWLYETGYTAFAIAVAAAGLVVAGVLLVVWLRGEAWPRIHSNRSADLAILMLTLVLPFAAPLGHAAFGWDPMAYATNTDLLRSAGLVAVMIAASIGISYYWFGMRDKDDFAAGVSWVQWAQLMGMFWLIQLLFFTTFLTNTRNGLASGVVGSLGYWLAQQEVARGGQPWYYYFLLGGLYEFLPWVLSIGGAITVLVGAYRYPAADPVAARDLPLRLREPQAPDRDASRATRLANRRTFAVFGVFWIAGSWAAYMVAGEKMPWLMTHIALPMSVFGGWWFAWLVFRINWKQARRAHAVWLIAATPALIFLLGILVGRGPSFGRTTEAVSSTLQWLIALVGFAVVIYFVAQAARGTGWKDAATLLGLGGLAILLLLTIRFTYMLNYVNYDMATEYLVYAHGSPDIKRALREIDHISERTVGDRNIEVAYDDESSWPLSWYMRLYPNSRFYGDNPTSDVMTAPVIIVGPKNFESVRPYVARDYVKRAYRRIWWPDQGYFNLTLQDAFGALTDREQLKRIFDIVFYRRYRDAEDPTRLRDLTQWPTRSDFEMYVRRDIAEEIWDLSVMPVSAAGGSIQAQLREREVPLSASAIFGAEYDGLPLLSPRAVAIGPQDTIVVADTGNHRVVVLDSAGGLQYSFGSVCRLGEAEAGGCIDPDGDGPLQIGDGQFNEPWGVAVSADGTIFVADTWNGRIQAFDSEGRFLRSWGYFNTTDGELGDPYALFGPRGVAVDAEGNLVVADTGNKRILRYSPFGDFIDQIGGGGVILGRFEEPTDVAVHPEGGSIYVADNWNRRIQILDPQLQAVAEWPVPGWESRDIYQKPSVSVASNGDVYVTDPEYYRVLVYDSSGEIKASFGDYGTEPDRFGLPNGIEVSAGTDSVVVADAGNNRVMVFPALP